MEKGAWLGWFDLRNFSGVKCFWLQNG